MAIRRPATDVPSDDWSRYHGKAMAEAEFLALDDAAETDLEYIDGIAREKGMVSEDRGRLAREFEGRLWLYQREAGGSGGPERRVRLVTGDHQKPDVAHWKPGIPSGNDTIPTLAVEIRSPGDTMAEQRRKCVRYIESGVPVCWLVDPVSRTVEVFDVEREGEPLPPDGVLETEELPGFVVPVAELFAVLEG